MQPEDPMYDITQEILKKCSENGISTDIIFGSDTHALLKRSSPVDISSYDEGDFSINFPVNGELSGIDTQFVSCIAKNIMHNFLKFRESWDRCIAPYLYPDFHNIVVFDKMDIDVYKEIGGPHIAYVRFKWLHMKCKFSKEKAVENRLYEWSHEPFTVATSHVTSYDNLIRLCKPLERSILQQGGQSNIIR